ncbi:hypothetical protein GCM10011512_02690 [Tersicoccus solisilvae]|uniref:Integral membrane protein n=1 Tax=Tersicoccus solisilvae TaxID=1882339 RepID=A0ABQ1NLB2_9MICC|nr:hypothetical protein [Tersicoccus solisilvae]GGC79529.1 hypothetical protein GCM10011512_02690 [Tersicoccus solisilvae]
MANSLLSRSLHDLSAAAWFGGSLMGAIGVNGAAAAAKDPAERTRLSTVGWGKWTPVLVGAFAAHGVGGVGLILDNKGRLAGQKGAGTNTVVKGALTVVGMGLSLYSGVLGSKIAKHADQGAVGATEPRSNASSELKSAQLQLKALQWVIPVVSGTVIVLGAQQGEQQRPTNVTKGLFKRR